MENPTPGKSDVQGTVSESPTPSSAVELPAAKPEENRPWWSSIKEPGSAPQIVVAALLAIALGVTISETVDDIPTSARVLVGIPGTLWLRALRAVVLPLIVTSVVLAIQQLKEMAKSGAAIARWTIGYFLCTTFIAIIQSALLTGLVWRRLFDEASPDSLSEDSLGDRGTELAETGDSTPVHEVILSLFESFIPQNVFYALTNDDLLAVLIAAMVCGYLLKPGSGIVRAVREVEAIVITIVTFLIKLAPIGVFFLILPNLFRLDIADIGYNLGILIGGAISMMAFHLFVVLSSIFYFITKTNPWVYWMKNSKSWITAWGTASSAATLPVTLQCCLDRGLPRMTTQFVVPLGTMINMDGTAIYFPIVVVFLAATQGHTLQAVDYIVICLLSTVATIGAAPIPSSSLVLTVMIANSIDVPITGMYAVVVAFDWFLDRFRTVVNVSGDFFGAAVVTQLAGITDDAEPEFVEGREDLRRDPSIV
ncbi:hypothetical protein LZ554_004493 [Drepanopeziza brunnea f. sp. 'monogermtubi']|nr:hypothetical protein LZ554_004493 [Drepanopeziza brunnea f. sp. 'monogermtubi']